MGFRRCVSKFLRLTFLAEYQLEVKAESKAPEFGALIAVLKRVLIINAALVTLVGLPLWLFFDTSPSVLWGRGSLQIAFVLMSVVTVLPIVFYYYRRLKPVEDCYLRLHEKQYDVTMQWYQKVVVRTFWLIIILGFGWPVVYLWHAIN